MSKDCNEYNQLYYLILTLSGSCRAAVQDYHVITCDTEVNFSVSVSLKLLPPVRDCSTAY